MKKEFATNCGVQADVLEECDIPKHAQDAAEKRNQLTELVFILDKSGSMHGLEKDTVGGFNSVLKARKEDKTKGFVTTVLFSTKTQIVHDRQPIETAPLMEEKDYQVDGWTALYDAIGQTVAHIEGIHKYARPEDVPAKTLIFITTDGMENASKRYTQRTLKELITRKEGEGWEFLFLAANVDAEETAEEIGIRKDRAANYCVETDTDCLYEAVEYISKCMTSPLSLSAQEILDKKIEEKKKRKK